MAFPKPSVEGHLQGKDKNWELLPPARAPWTESSKEAVAVRRGAPGSVFTASEGREGRFAPRALGGGCSAFSCSEERSLCKKPSLARRPKIPFARRLPAHITLTVL